MEMESGDNNIYEQQLQGATIQNSDVVLSLEAFGDMICR